MLLIISVVIHCTQMAFPENDPSEHLSQALHAFKLYTTANALTLKTHSKIHQLYNVLCLLKAFFSLTSELCFLLSLSNTRNASQPMAAAPQSLKLKHQPTLCLQLSSAQQIIIIELLYYFVCVCGNLHACIYII